MIMVLMLFTGLLVSSSPRAEAEGDGEVITASNIENVLFDLDAYISGAETAQNGSVDSYQVIDLTDTIDYEFTIENSNEAAADETAVPKVPTVSNPEFEDPGTTAPARIDFQNGSFNTPAMGSSLLTSTAYTTTTTTTSVPPWFTKDSKGTNSASSIRLARPYNFGKPGGYQGYYPDTSIDGNQMVMLQAAGNYVYQTIDTTPGTNIYWEFYHHSAGSGVGAPENSSTLYNDVMSFYLNKTGTTPTQLIQKSSIGYAQGWVYYSGYYTVPAGQTQTDVLLQGLSTGRQDSINANFVDAVRIFSGSYISLELSNNAPDATVLSGDTFDYTIEAQNTGESDARSLTISQILPAGIELVPDSVRIDDVATANYSYDEITRELSVNVGGSADKTSGGLVKGFGSPSQDCNDTYTLTFSVQVVNDQIAANMLYETQAKATYQDRNQASTTSNLYNYSAVDTLSADDLTASTAAVFTFTLPAGLVLLDVQISDATTANNSSAGNKVSFYWDTLPVGTTTILVLAEIDPDTTALSFVGYGTLQVGDASDTAGPTYHVLSDLNAGDININVANYKKNAFINNDLVNAKNGQSDAYQVVRPGDQVTYTISVDNSALPDAESSGVQYDVLFAVDWSGSMVLGTMNAAGNNGLDYARNLSSDISQYILSNYPGSRVSLLGMANYAYSSNLNDPSKLYVVQGTVTSTVNGEYVQTLNIIDTDFVDNIDDFNSQVLPLFGISGSTDSGDDTAILLQASTAKMNGQSQTFNIADRGSTTNTAYSLIPRQDSTRIPVIVMISDFQIPFDWNIPNTTLNYWQYAFGAEATNFYNTFTDANGEPNGILLTTRLDTSMNSTTPAGADVPKYNNPVYDNLMTTYVTTPERAAIGWAFTKLNSGMSYTAALAALKASFSSSVPIPVPVFPPSFVTDTIPAGLTINPSSVVGGTISGQTVTWDLNKWPAGPITLSVTTTVQDPAQSGHPTFKNTAFVSPSDPEKAQQNTNSTYHTTKVYITERFVDFQNQEAALADDHTFAMTAGQNYSPASGVPPATLTSSGTDYSYWGYQVDGGDIHAGRPDRAILPSNIGSAHTITYYYVAGEAGAPIKTAYLNGSAQTNDGTVDVPVPVQIGDTITYNIDFFLSTETQAKGGTLTDTVPDGLQIESSNVLSRTKAFPNQDTASHDSQTLSWDIASLPAGDITVEVVTTVTAFGNFQNRADFDINGEPNYCTNTTYHQASTSWGFYKVNEYTEPLEGAEFSLYYSPDAGTPGFTEDNLATNGPFSTWKPLDHTTSASDGLVEFSGLLPGDYMLVETQALPGYQLPYGQWLVTIDPDPDAATDAPIVHEEGHSSSATSMPPPFIPVSLDNPAFPPGALILHNFPQMDLPAAGGPGVAGFMVVGIAFMGLGVIMAVFSRHHFAGRRRKLHSRG